MNFAVPSSPATAYDDGIQEQLLMVKVTYIAYDGAEKTVEVEPGMSLMEGAVQNGVDGIDADCGGNCYCGTCRVYVSESWREKLGLPNEYEEPMIESTGDTDPSVRLSCQVRVTEDMDGLVVRTPKFQK
jgi:2Fe-2S ferredoxin